VVKFRVNSGGGNRIQYSGYFEIKIRMDIAIEVHEYETIKILIEKIAEVAASVAWVPFI